MASFSNNRQLSSDCCISCIGLNDSIKENYKFIDKEIYHLLYKHKCYIEFLVTIFLRVKISFLQANQKARMKYV